jgi:hypothetical protein
LYPVDFDAFLGILHVVPMYYGTPW